MSTKVEVTATDLRRELYDKLRTAGVVDNLKTHLRSQMLCQLQEQQPALLARAESSHNIWHRVANSLVADFLKLSKYNYSLSIFLVSFKQLPVGFTDSLGALEPGSCATRVVVPEWLSCQ
eukprot:5766909-Pyramimonas_sp.AAC.2